MIAVLTVGDTPKLDASWDGAVAAVAKSPQRTIAAGLSGPSASTAIRDYFGLLDKYNVSGPTFDIAGGNGKGNGPDRLPPTTPLGATVTNATSTSVDLAWIASTDNVGVAGYGIYLNGSLVGSTAATSFTLKGLVCATSYTFSIDAYDKRGNRSQKVTITGSTGACPLPPPPSSGDTTPPSQPGGLTTSGVSKTSMTLGWSPSLDNVAVAGYEVSKDGAAAGTTSSTSYLLGHLSCGSSHTFAVKAYDAAGNRSQAATITAVTAPCATTTTAADTEAPSTPSALHATSATVDSISLAWTASTDNVGVAGYGAYSNGTLAGSTNSTSYTVSGLTCGTSYTLAVDAYDAAGNHSQRAAITATTSACPAATDTQAPTVPSGVHATGATPTSITVAWTASTDNIGVAGYSVYNGSATAGSTTSTSYTVSGLSCGATYTLAVDAYDAAGNRSSKTSITTPTSACAVSGQALDAQPPTTPAGLHVTSATTSSITVAWTASTDNVGVTGYGLYRSGTSTGTTTSTSATFSGLACGTGYTLAVDAYDAAGNRSAQATVSSPTSACLPATDTQAPTTPGNLHVTAATTTSISVAWDASTDNVAVSGYALYRNGTPTGLTTSTSGTFSSLACGTGYTLAVDAYDAAGNRSTKATVTASTGACAPPPPADTQAPTMPSNLHVTAATTTSITVAWTASTDNVGVAGYGLYRSGTPTGLTTSTSATFSNLTCGTGYTLSVDAYDAAGNRSAQASISSPTSACAPTADTQAPTTPGGLNATGATATSITVAWTASTDNVGVSGYGLYRNGTSTGSTTSTTSTFSGLSCGTGYTLAVDAYDAAGNRSAKASITASTGACAPPADTQAPTTRAGLSATATTANSITVAWTASTDNVGVTGYSVYNGGSTAGSTAGTSYTVSGLSCGTSYTLAVDAYDAAGNRSTKASIAASTSACAPPADTQAPTTPGGLSATGATATSVTVAWTASTDNVGVTGYGLYRNGTSTGTTTSTSATFSGLTCGTSYTLAVDAYDAAGNRSSKASVAASTSACAPAADTQAPSTPSGLNTTGATATSITVGWTASTDNVGVTGYGLYRNSTSTGQRPRPARRSAVSPAERRTRSRSMPSTPRGTAQRRRASPRRRAPVRTRRLRRRPVG